MRRSEQWAEIRSGVEGRLSAPLIAEFAAQIGASELLSAKGCLYLYDTRKSFSAAMTDIELRRGYGVGRELLSVDEVLRLEPRLPPFEGGGLFFPDAISLSDPGEAMHRLSAAVRRAGVEFIQASAQEIEREPNGILITAAPFEICARTAIISAGAHSQKLAAQIGDPVRLDTERGYHVEFDMAEPPIERPICPTAHGFYLCPMQGRLRVAGLVELGDLAAPANPRLLQALRRMHAVSFRKSANRAGPIPYPSSDRRVEGGTLSWPSAMDTSA